MKKVFIACDTSDIQKAKKIINQYRSTKKIKFGIKFGLQFFYSKNGRSFLSKIKDREIFLDLKLNDIPQTCKAALFSLKDLKNIRYITVHINSGQEVIKQVKLFSKKINKKVKILGVTVLTSFSNSALKKIGYTKNLNQVVLNQVKLAKKCNLDGIVTSGDEIIKVKKICKNMEIVVPGIRFKGGKKHDQKRVIDPIEAFSKGATSIVMGRSLTEGNLKNNFRKLRELFEKI